ncbi:hypothetical protein A3860_01030 [Niastella vici]|uniref:Uncharacterized protein n=1 Tax=Niastella vici TaxID=1703345 RepID=A0A1V9G8M8_9BACT|nr:hypothetical protein A3860_01030 [Niastella vici]
MLFEQGINEQGEKNGISRENQLMKEVKSYSRPGKALVMGFSRIVEQHKSAIPTKVRPVPTGA